MANKYTLRGNVINGIQTCLLSNQGTFKCVWPGNATIICCIATHSTVWKRQRAITDTRLQEDKKEKQPAL